MLGDDAVAQYARGRYTGAGAGAGDGISGAVCQGTARPGAAGWDIHLNYRIKGLTGSI